MRMEEGVWSSAEAFQRKVLVCACTCAGGEERGVGDIQPGGVPALAALVHHGSLGGGAHARSAHLVRREDRHAVLLHACSSITTTHAAFKSRCLAASAAGMPACAQALMMN